MAITEKYVNNAGAGAHDGTSDANAFSWAEMITDINAGGKAGNRYNVKQDGTYANGTSTTAFTGDGTSTSPIIIRGYKTTITDGFLGRTSGNGALITTNMPVITYTTGGLLASGSDWLVLESLSITSARTGNTVIVGVSCAVKSCVITNSSTNAGAIGLTTGTATVAFDNDISLTGASGGGSAVSLAGGGSRVLANRISGGPAVGISIGAGFSLSVVDNLIYSSVGKQIVTTSNAATCLIYGNTIAGGTTNGIEFVTGSTVLQAVINNMITDNGGIGIAGISDANAIFAAYNRTRDNSGGADANAADWLAATKYGQVTTDTGGAETDYTNAAGGDYSLISASPAKGAGWWPYRDIGAVQRQEAASSGGASNAIHVIGQEGVMIY